jgi:hypothetical protein
MTIQKAIEQIGKQADKVQAEASGSGVTSDRQIYLWGLQDGYRHAIEIMGEKITVNEQ